MEKILLFFKKLGIFLTPELEKCSGEFHYDKYEDRLNILIKTKTLLSIKSLNEIYSAVTSKKVKFNLKIVTEDKKFEVDDFDDYLLFIRKNFPKFSDLQLENKTDAHLHNGKVTIRVSTYDILVKCDEQAQSLVSELNNLGLYVTEIVFNLPNDKKEEISKQITNDHKENKDIARKEHEKVLAERNAIENTANTFKKVYSRSSAETIEKIDDIDSYFSNAAITGEVFNLSVFTSRNGKNQFKFSITDGSNSIFVKVWENAGNENSDLRKIKIGDIIRCEGEIKEDSFDPQAKFVMFAKNISILPPKELSKDIYPEKRVELNLHTNMTTMNGINSAEDYINQAHRWGMKAIAITDIDSVQSFPNAQKAASKLKDFKVIYGTQLNIMPDFVKIVHNPKDINLFNTEIVLFDLETTGLSSEDNEIIEFGAIKLNKDGSTERKQIFIKPKKSIPEFITKLTGINDEMVINKSPIELVIHDIKDFFGDAILVAHNSTFDMGFINKAYSLSGMGQCENSVIDTMQLSRALNTQLQYHRLGSVARYFNISYDDDIAHRADYDAEVLKNVFVHMRAKIETVHKIVNLKEINERLQNDNLHSKSFTNTVNILAKNQSGITKIFELVSLSLTENFYKKGKIKKSQIESRRKDLLIGSSGALSEIFEIARTKSENELIEAMKWYDFIEIQPVSTLNHLLARDYTIEQLEKLMIRIVKAAQSINKLIVATGDVFYIDKKHKKARDIYINAKQIGGTRHYLFDWNNKEKLNPDSHFRTTEEMMNDFPYLDEKTKYEYVILSSNKIADQIENCKPMKDTLFAPKVEGVEEEITEKAFAKARKIYGPNLPSIVEERLNRELKAIIGNKFAVVYWSASKLVNKSLNDGYLVGSRGSVGSSLVATMCSITEVNPLKPHYICDKCQYHDFEVDHQYEDGYDLPPIPCPKCKHTLRGDGHNIPFETFMGFKGDKVPDIDLNFSGEYQANAHNLTKEMFGESHVFRAGTISTVANKTAFGYVLAYLEDMGIKDTTNQAEKERLAKMCEGVKRTTGQHPGGIIVIPKEHTVNDFTPINYPADDTQSDWYTTHFEFEAIHDNLLKLDLLGHLDPTAIRMLQDYTKIDPLKIPMYDPKVMKMFLDITQLNIDSSKINDETTGAIGLPEFGTEFVRELLREAKPHSFADLIRISGLSHGTNVWTGNAQSLIKNSNGSITLKNVITVRDDIMLYLIDKGVEPSIAFKIMEDVRKGKGLTPEYMQLLIKHQIPTWYIESAKKIAYIFPKAHATAYVIMAWRIAWFKYYFPIHYYAVFFSTRCEVFDVESFMKGEQAIRDKIESIKSKMKDPQLKYTIKQKDKDLLLILEVGLEMYLRGIKFTNISLAESDNSKFVVTEDNKIRPPFAAIDGLGISVANSIIDARKEKQFTSIADLEHRTSVNKNHIEFFKKHKVLGDLPDDSQIKMDW